MHLVEDTALPGHESLASKSCGSSPIDGPPDSSNGSWTLAMHQVTTLLAEDSSGPQSMRCVVDGLARVLAKDHGQTVVVFRTNSKQPDVLNCQYLPETDSLWSPGAATANSHAITFPVVYKSRFFGVLEIVSQKKCSWSPLELEILGSQIGQALLLKETESERERLANILCCSTDAIITVTDSLDVLSWNQSAEKLLKVSKEEAIDNNLHGLNGWVLLNLLAESFKNSTTILQHETSIQDAQEHYIDVEVTASPLLSVSAHQGYSFTCRDISERKQAENRVSEFYSMVSHELRAPLTSIRGVLGLIEGNTVEAGSAEALELISVARSSTDRLIRLLNDILDLKKIEAGKLELHRTEIEIDELVHWSLSSLKGMADVCGVKLKAVLNDDLDCVFADWDKTTQVITNLVSNAIKFTPAGEVVTVIAEQGDQNCVRIRVIDTGPGIAKCDIDKLFDKFKQLTCSDGRPATVGSGLGLAISRALVEEHGGVIGVTSSPEGGSEFWFQLPKGPR